jgi:predicted methyltransferase MtxX (methanogen marker protein 4)
MSIQELLGGEVVFPTHWPSLPKSDLRAERVISKVQAAVPYLARVVASIGGVRADEEVAPYMDLLERAMADLQITEAEAEAVLVIAALADGKVTAAERRDLDAAANLLALGPGIVEAYLYEVSETV